MEIILSLTIFSSLILTDGNNFVSNSVGIYRRNKAFGDTVGIYHRSIPSVYTDRIADGLYSLFEKLQQCGDMDLFQMILLTE